MALVATTAFLGLVAMPPPVTVRRAEATFVSEENLEDGENCELALKAFDAAGSFLCAGALLRRRSATLNTDVHDCWIADSIEAGVGPNLQQRGAQLVLDRILLEHLESELGEPSASAFSVFAGDGTGTVAAAHAAARSRGFVSEASCADTDETVLRFDPAEALLRYEDEAALLTAEQQPPEQEQEAPEQEQEPPEQELLEQEQLGVVHSILGHLRRRSPPPAMAMRSVLADLSTDDWQPLQTRIRWRNPCFFSSFLTALSVVAAWRCGAPVFGAGPSLVLLSSLNYWRHPQRETRRRTLDLIVVRTGLAWQVLLSACRCQPGWAPRLLGGYSVGASCYAVGRVLTVRRQLWAGAWVHCGVHVFANLGNVLVLPLIRW